MLDYLCKFSYIFDTQTHLHKLSCVQLVRNFSEKFWSTLNRKMFAAAAAAAAAAAVAVAAEQVAAAVAFAAAAAAAAVVGADFLKFDILAHVFALHRNFATVCYSVDISAFQSIYVYRINKLR